MRHWLVISLINLIIENAVLNTESPFPPNSVSPSNIRNTEGPAGKGKFVSVLKELSTMS
jgi:hypothetical protein